MPYLLVLLIFAQIACGDILPKDFLQQKCQKEFCVLVKSERIEDRLIYQVATQKPIPVIQLDWILSQDYENRLIIWLEKEDLIAAHKSQNWKSIITKNENYLITKSCPEILELSLLLNAKLFIVCHKNQEQVLFEAYSKSLTLSPHIIIQNACPKVEICNPTPEIWFRRQDLTNVTLIAAMLPYPPLAYYDKNGKITGIFPDLFLEMQQSLNFNYKLTSPKGKIN